MDEIINAMDEALAEISLTEAQYGMPPLEAQWPRFPEGSLSESAVVAVSDHVQVAYEMAASAALGAMSTACQGLVDVEFPNGHRVPTSLMLLIAAKTGERKTALENWFFGPIRKLQSEKEADFNRLHLVYVRELKTWQDKEKVLRKKVNKAFQEEQSTDALEQRLAEHDKVKPAPPAPYRLIYDNTTPSALTYGLHTSIPMACLLSSEAGSLFSGKAFEDLYLFNALWSGSPISVTRRTSESFTLDEARLTAALMIQPEIIQRFLDKRGDAAHGSGFLARFLFAYPPPMVGNRQEIPSGISDADILPFQKRIRELLLESLEALDNKNTRRVLTFNASAKHLWKKMYRHIEKETRPDQVYSHAEGHASKLMDNITRIAGILHLFEGYEGDISTNTLALAYCLGRHYSRHYLTHIAGEPEIVTLGNRLVQDIRKHNDYRNEQCRFVVSDITQITHPSLRRKAKMKAALTLLQRLGHLKRVPNSKQLFFQETIIGNKEPVLKNGEIYYLETLYRFDKQSLTPRGPGILPSIYQVNSSLDDELLDNELG